MSATLAGAPPRPPVGSDPAVRSHIVFASTYPPVVCGVGTYTSYLADAMPRGRASVVAFDPKLYGAPVAPGGVPDARVPVSHCLARPAAPGALMEAVTEVSPVPLARTVLWFQHAWDIWPRFPRLLRALSLFPAPKVASFHGVHFESPETPWGLWAAEHRTLRQTLPLLDRVTVFTPAAGDAVRAAFPKHASKVTVLRHGVHSPRPLSRMDARRRLAEYLAGVQGWVSPRGAAPALVDALADPDCLFVGALGFLQADKGFEVAYRLSDALRARLPGRRIVALVMGSVRDPRNRRNRRLLSRLAAAAGDGDRFLVAAGPPDDVFRAGLRAVVLNVYWPDAPTQSGRIAHALGVGATVIGRDVEGVGETLRDAGAPVCGSFDELVSRATRLLGDAGYADSLRAHYQQYARDHSWEEQAGRHVAFADALVAVRARPAGPVHA